MPAVLHVRRLARGAAVVLLLGSVAACSATGKTLNGVLASAAASAEPTLAADADSDTDADTDADVDRGQLRGQGSRPATSRRKDPWSGQLR